nr:Uncharacterised protein [Raoultella sp. NCTC 9187]
MIERGRISRLFALGCCAGHAFGKKRRIADNQLIASGLRRLPLLNIGLMYLDTGGPWRSNGVFPRLFCRLFIQFNRIQRHLLPGTLSQHQGQQAAAGSDIQHVLNLSNRRPRAEQNTVGTHFHCAAVVSDKELFKRKTIARQRKLRLRHPNNLAGKNS